jgi:uncharacterized membrane protein
MVDLLTYINVDILGLKPFQLNLFKTSMMVLFAATGMGLLFSDAFVRQLGNRTADLNVFTIRQQRILGWCVGLSFTVFLIYLRVRQYFELETLYDMAVEANVAWHMVHGPWFFNSLDNDSFLGGHFSPVFVLIGLVYRWAEHPITLLVIQSLAFGAGAVAVYYLALARQTTTSVALFAMMLFIFNPYVHHSNAHDFHISPLAIASVLWLLFFIDSDQPWKAGATALLSFSIEESILLPLVGLGIYLIVVRPQWRIFGLALGVSAFLYFVLIIKFLMPMFTPGSGLFFWDRYANLGNNLNEAIYNLLSHPIWAAKEILLRGNQYIYLLYFLIPVAFLPLFSLKEAFLIVIPLSIMFLSQNPGMYKLGFHYSAPTLPFLFYGVVYGLSKLSDYHASLGVWQKHARILLAGVFFLLALNTYRSPGYDLGQTAPQFASSAFALSSLIPSGASVATEMRFGPLLANRHQICEVGSVPGEVCTWPLEFLSDQNWSRPHWQPEYVMIGAESGKVTSDILGEQSRFAQWLADKRGYEEIETRDGIRLFRSRVVVGSTRKISEGKD